MRILLAGVLGLIVSACASGGPAPQRDVAEAMENRQSPDFVTGLPAQRLAPGQCGVFLFEARPPNQFVMFEDEAARTVKIVHAGEIYEIGFTEQPGAFLPGEAFRRIYFARAENLTFLLEGQVGGETRAGRRIEDVILTARQLDGTRTVRPLAGVRRCQDG